MTELQQRIFDYVAANQPVTIASIVKSLSIYRSQYYRETEYLRESGKLTSMPGVGVFAGMSGLNAWLDNGGADLLSNWGKSNALARRNAETVVVKEDRDDSPKMFMPYRPKKNRVVPECLSSDFHRRVMMVYGRAS